MGVVYDAEPSELTICNPKIRMLLIDIKPENFLYKSNEKVEDSLYKVLDWDSIIEFDKNYKIKGTHNLHYTDTYSPNEIIKANSIDKIDIRTAIFMLSVVLYRAIFRNAIMIYYDSPAGNQGCMASHL